MNVQSLFVPPAWLRGVSWQGMIGRQARLRDRHGGSRGRGKEARPGRMDGFNSRARSDGESFDTGGVDTSFDDVLDIVVPYATYGSRTW